jgi:hypothetical protein
MRPDASLANERVVLEKEFAMMLRATADAMAIEKKEGTGVPPFFASLGEATLKPQAA